MHCKHDSVLSTSILAETLCAKTSACMLKPVSMQVEMSPASNVMLWPELCLRLFTTAIGLWCLHVRSKRAHSVNSYATTIKRRPWQNWPRCATMDAMIALIAYNTLQRLWYLDEYIRKGAATVYREAQVSARHAVRTSRSCRVTGSTKSAVQTSA